MNGSGFLVRFVVDGFKDKHKLIFDFGLAQKVLSQVVGFNFSVLVVFYHDFMSGSIEPDVLELPDFEVEASALAYAMEGIGRHLGKGRWV
jgi:hypothetical protein